VEAWVHLTKRDAVQILALPY